MTLQDEKNTLSFGEQLSKVISAPFIIFLEGELGAGKTTLTRGFLRGLGWVGKVKSPTYTLIESYDLSFMRVYHCDFYRLNNEYELQEIDFEAYSQDEKAILLIEWPAVAKNLIRSPDIRCILKHETTGRTLCLIAASERGADLLQTLTKV